MFEVFRKIWRTGTVTSRQPFAAAADKYRGKIDTVQDKCTGCGECVALCPSNAISLSAYDRQAALLIDHGKCVFCGNCAQYCPAQALQITTNCYLAAKDRQQLIEASDITWEGAGANGR
ncbi:MAG: 4Fe-4S binding protein [Sporomusa sp.]